jgi:hypothetical protein
MHEWMLRGGLNGLEITKRRTHFPGEGEREKKEEFPGLMENMLPENSFPQICVVSKYKCL